MSCGIFRFAKNPTCTTCNELFTLIHDNIKWKKIKSKYGFYEDVAELPFNIPRVNKLLDSLHCFKGMYDTTLMKIFKNNKPYAKMSGIASKLHKGYSVNIIYQDAHKKYKHGKFYQWEFGVWKDGQLDYLTGEDGTNYKMINQNAR